MPYAGGVDPGFSWHRVRLPSTPDTVKFLLLVQGASGLELKKFGRDGRPEWVLSEIESDFPESLPYNIQPVVGPTGADLYLVDYLSKRIIKLYDHTYGEDEPVVSRVVELNEGIIESQGAPGAFARKAEYYEQIGTAEFAQTAWKRLTASRSWVSMSFSPKTVI